MPGKPVFIFEPAALSFLAAGGQLLPKFIHFRLRFAVHDKGDGLVEFEIRAAVKGDEPLSFDFEDNGHHRAFGPATGIGSRFTVTGHVQDFRFFENRSVKLNGFFGLIIEP